MRPGLLRLVALAGLGGALVLGSRSAAAAASASEKKLAKEMLAEAVTDEKAGKCADAIEVFRQIVKIQESGEVLLHLGECLTKTGKLVEALRTWERAEDLARDDKDRATQQALIPKLAALRERMPALALQIPADVTGVAVTVDGQAVPRERTGTPIPLDPGEHTVEARAEGRTPFSKKVTLAEKDSTVVAVVLPSTAPPSEVAPAKGGGVPIGTWIAGSAGLAMAGGGIVAFLAAGSAASEGATQCVKLVSCEPGSVKTVRQLDATALGLWIGAGVGIGLGVTLWAIDGPPKPKAAAQATPRRSAAGARPALRPGPRVVIRPGSVSLEGRF